MVLLLVLTSCGTWQTQDQDVTTGANSSIKQVQDQNAGSNKVEAELVESVTTINEQGVDVQMLVVILGSVGLFSIFIGLLIPRPRFIKWFF
tara:strand:+ start:116 stop:388 length:273 start_codon:yes stop_codon:yes gene_type:complete